jgi:methanethiol oxidase
MAEHSHTDDQRPRSFHASPAEALEAPRERFLYLACLHRGTGVDEPDFIAVVDANPDSDSYGEIVDETAMPNVGDELHHFGWNRCSSACHGPDRSHLIVPGFRSSRIHILDVASNPRRPRIEKVIEAEELAEKTGYSRPHTVHCMPGDNVVVSMLGDRDGGGAGGFACLDARTFEIKGRWENGGPQPKLNYDFWYQPRKNVLISSEFGEPNAYEPGFDIEDVAAGRYGQRLHFWNLAERRLEQTLDLGEAGLVPLEVRWLHDPEAAQGFVGAALASNIFRFHRSNGTFQAEPVIDVENEELEGWPLPGGVPGLITDLVLSMNDRFLYFSNWLHGDLRQYDVSDPEHPKLTGRLWLGGLLGKESDAGRELSGGGPQMLQLSLDGRRLYVTNSLYSTWDNQFYPGLRSWLLKVDCDPEGGMEVDRDFFVDFHERPSGPARAHEVRLEGGDCTTEIFQ